MVGYRLYLMNLEGRFTGVHEFMAASDSDAGALAERHARNQPFELWETARLVRRQATIPRNVAS